MSPLEFKFEIAKNTGSQTELVDAETIFLLQGIVRIRMFLQQ